MSLVLRTPPGAYRPTNNLQKQHKQTNLRFTAIKNDKSHVKLDIINSLNNFAVRTIQPVFIRTNF